MLVALYLSVILLAACAAFSSASRHRFFTGKVKTLLLLLSFAAVIAACVMAFLHFSGWHILGLIVTYLACIWLISFLLVTSSFKD